MRKYFHNKIELWEKNLIIYNLEHKNPSPQEKNSVEKKILILWRIYLTTPVSVWFVFFSFIAVLIYCTEWILLEKIPRLQKLIETFVTKKVVDKIQQKTKVIEKNKYNEIISKTWNFKIYTRVIYTLMYKRKLIP